MGWQQKQDSNRNRVKHPYCQFHKFCVFLQGEEPERVLAERKYLRDRVDTNNLCFYTALLNAFRAACSLHACRHAPRKQLENQIKIFGENSIVYFVPVP